jgi:hypothetical protein
MKNLSFRLLKQQISRRFCAALGMAVLFMANSATAGLEVALSGDFRSSAGVQFEAIGSAAEVMMVGEVLEVVLSDTRLRSQSEIMRPKAKIYFNQGDYANLNIEQEKWYSILVGAMRSPELTVLSLEVIPTNASLTLAGPGHKNGFMVKKINFIKAYSGPTRTAEK